MATLSHDLYVLEVRRLAEKIWGGGWIPERAMKHELGGKNLRIPDGMLILENQKRISFEVENTLKARKRYQEIFDSYSRAGHSAILYVATTERIFRGLQDIVREISCQTRVGVIELDQLKSDRPSIWTLRGPIDLFSQEVAE